MLKSPFASTFQETLAAKLDTHLGMPNAMRKTKTRIMPEITTAPSGWCSVGDTDIALPRDRKGEFEPLVV